MTEDITKPTSVSDADCSHLPGSQAWSRPQAAAWTTASNMASGGITDQEGGPSEPLLMSLPRAWVARQHVGRQSLSAQACCTLLQTVLGSDSI